MREQLSKLTLYPYQEEGVEWLVENPRANLYLADEMGLGKTVQAIVAAQRLGAERILVICPAAGIGNWRREWLEWSDGTGRLRVTSYDRLVRHYRKIRKAGWDLVILDEAHYAKTPSAKRTRRALTIASEASQAWLLSGTPMPNHTGELWAPTKYLWPEFPARFGITQAAQWLEAFAKCTPSRYGPRPYAVKNVHLLKPFLAEVMLRRTWQQVGLDLPPLRVDVSLLERDEAFASQLAAMLADGGIDYVLEAESDDPHTSRLRHFLGRYKARKVGDILVKEMADGAYEKIVVLGYHHDTLDALGETFTAAEIGYVGFRGGATTSQRQAAIDDFDERPEVRVFLAQSTSAGIAINLQSAHELVLVEPGWSPPQNFQAIKRIHRIGQKHPCRARMFAVPDTLDDRIMEVIAQKLRMITEVGL